MTKERIENNETLMIIFTDDYNKLFLYRIDDSFVGNNKHIYQILKNNEELVKVFIDYDTARKFMYSNEIKKRDLK